MWQSLAKHISGIELLVLRQLLVRIKLFANVKLYTLWFADSFFR